MWRIIVGFGTLPALAAVYFRLTIPETPRYTFDVDRDPVQASADFAGWIVNTVGPWSSHGHVLADRQDHRARLQAEQNGGLDQVEVPVSSWKDFKHHVGQWRNSKVLLGTAGSWLMLDVAFYGLALNNVIFLDGIGFGASEKVVTIYHKFRLDAIGNFILVCGGGLVGSLLTVFWVDRIGRKPIQILGFSILAILLLALGFAFDHIKPAARMALFVLIQLFFNFGMLHLLTFRPRPRLQEYVELART